MAKSFSTNSTGLSLSQWATDLSVRCEFGDLLLFVYFVVLTRQWFWSLSNTTAWGLTIPIAISLWLFYVSQKDRVEKWPGIPFWLVVGLPLFFAFALRAPFPDSSFDVWGLRLFHGDRGLAGFIYLSGEFFPTAAPFNPTPDMVTGAFRYLLGYRMGTVVNLIALLCAGTVLDRLLVPLIGSHWLRATGVLLCLWAEHLLFEISNYMPDLLALPLLLEATRLTVINSSAPLNMRRVVLVAFLLGVAVALKLSNGAMAAPLVLIWAWRILRKESFGPGALATALAAIVVFTAPLLPFSVWVYKLTGSPTFPIYNGFFGSPLYPPFNGWDDRWGGFGASEILSWPLLMFLNPERTSELSVYSGRLTVAFIVALVCIAVWRRVDQTTRLLAFIIVVATLLWSLTMGYIRYGLYLEVLSGLLLVSLAARLFFTPRLILSRQLLATVICTLLIVQSAFASIWHMRLEWSMRPTVFQESDSFTRELRHVFRDRSVRSLLSNTEREMYDSVEVWIVSGAKTPALMLLLNDKPLFIGARYKGLLLTKAARERFASAIANTRNNRRWSLAFPSDYEEAVFALRNVGLGVGRIQTVKIPFFSPDNRVHAYFFEVTHDSIERSQAVRTKGEMKLPAKNSRAHISAWNVPTLLKPGETTTLFLRIENLGEVAWPSLGQVDDKYRIAVRGRWAGYSADRIEGNVRAFLPYDLPPGESTILALTVRAPLDPGNHNLEIGLTQEGVSTLGDWESEALHLGVRIEP